MVDVARMSLVLLSEHSVEVLQAVHLLLGQVEDVVLPPFLSFSSPERQRRVLLLATHDLQF